MEPAVRTQRVLGPQYLDLGLPFYGYDKSLPAREIHPQALSDANAVRIKQGILRPGKGRVQLGSNLSGGVQLIIRFMDYAASPQNLILTTTNLYKWNSGTEDWVSVQDGFSGDQDIPATHCFGENQLIFTNGVDPVKTYDGTDVTNLGGGSDYQDVGTTHLAKIVRYYDNRLILFNTIEDSNNIYQRVRWSNSGAVATWTSDDFRDLVDTPGQILGAELIGAHLGVYKEDAIVYMEKVGGTYTFHFSDYEFGAGIHATNSLIPIRDSHIFLGESSGRGINVFINQGGRILPLGDAIQPVLEYQLSRDKILISWAFWDTDEKSIIMMVPAWDSDVPNKAWRYELLGDDLMQGRWMPDADFAATAGCRMPRGDYISYGELVGAYIDQDWYYGDARHQADAKMTVLGDETGDVFYLDGSIMTDHDGNAFDEFIVSKAINYRDLGALSGTKIRFLGAEFFARGGSVTVSYSTDEGDTWTALSATTLTSPFARYKVDFDVTAETLMLRLRNNATSGKFQLSRWILLYKLGGRR